VEFYGIPVPDKIGIPALEVKTPEFRFPTVNNFLDLLQDEDGSAYNFLRD
jgi:hypothetical protein